MYIEKSKLKLGKTSYGAVRKDAGGNDTVPSSVCRGRGMCRIVSYSRPIAYFSVVLSHDDDVR